MDIILKMRSIMKSFPGVLANDQVNFDLERGEIHALLGENGAGKTTLMNILYGLYKEDSGDIYINNRKVNIHSPKDAIDNGIGMVHQNFMLVPTMTVAQNIILGNEPVVGPFLKFGDALEKIKLVSEEYGFNIPLNREIWQLSVGEQQRVEILKVLYREAQIMILDEPTSVLTPYEVDALSRTLQAITRKGKSVIFISHKLKEVFDLCSRATILRHGKVVGYVNLKETTKNEIAQLMIGKEISYQERATTLEKIPDTSRPILRLEGVTAKGDRDILALKDISFDIYPGEILGVAGVDGNGQSELAEVICGLRALNSGRVLLKENDLGSSSPIKRAREGIWYIPSDRNKRGSVPSLSIITNSTLKNHRWQPFSSLGFLRLDRMKQFARQIVTEYDVRCPNVDVSASTLSGGNLQKLILAREIAHNLTLLVAENPTRGLDVSATEFVRKKLVELRGSGASILLISADLDELLRISDRIFVIYEGEITYTSRVDEMSMERLSLAMTGLERPSGKNVIQ